MVSCAATIAWPRAPCGLLPSPGAAQGITAGVISQFFSPYIDVISLGSLTHGYAVADFSLKIAKGAGLAAIEKVTNGSACRHGDARV